MLIGLWAALQRLKALKTDLEVQVQEVSVLSAVLAERLMIKLQWMFAGDAGIMEIILAKTSLVHVGKTWSARSRVRRNSNEYPAVVRNLLHCTGALQYNRAFNCGMKMKLRSWQNWLWFALRFLPIFIAPRLMSGSAQTLWSFWGYFLVKY